MTCEVFSLIKIYLSKNIFEEIFRLNLIKMPSNNRGKNLHKIIEDYSDHSTILGLFYVFQKNQTFAGRIFWALVVATMTILGAYW